MKKIFFVFCMLPVLFLSGQAYHPLIRTNVFWDVAHSVLPTPCYMSVTRSEFIEGDSLIEGHLYRFQNIFPFLGTAGPGGSLCPPYTVDSMASRGSSLREDTVTKKVYIYNPMYDPHESLLYDFSLLPGDTFTSAYATMGNTFTVYDVDSIMIQNGEFRKRFCFDQDCIINYIEGIGSWQGLSEPVIPGIGFRSELLCVKEAMQPIWGPSCDYQFVSIPDHTQPYVHLSPVPAHNQLTIEFPSAPGKVTIELFNLYGQVCATIIAEPHTERAVMDVSRFSPGIYLIRVTTEKRMVATEKVILNNF